MQMKRRTKLSTRSNHPTAVKLELDKTEPGDELFPNGIFDFNITRLLSFIEANVDQFPIERIGVDDIPNYGSDRLDEEAISSADLLRPILLAEISPGRFNLIDGQHRVAKARKGRRQDPARSSRRLPLQRAIPHFHSYVRAVRRILE
jgi:hypothetical protein